jgi:CRISPR system Cascade subunit CasA
MSFNLLRDAAFPARRRSGARAFLRFSELLDEGDDPPVDFDWPRADLNVASLEFGVGVLRLAFQPDSQEAWRALWRDGLTPARIEEAIASFSHAFALDGDGPRFMQDFNILDGEANPVEALFIDTPGANGQKKNTDVLTHRNRYSALGLPAAAMTLYAMQQFAPSGGAGNRTSMRGGGPMTTLVWPARDDGAEVSLGRVMLANLPAPDRPVERLASGDLARALPWLAPTLTSEKNREISESDPAAHPLQAHFGMPRRIRLVIGAEDGLCALTGRRGPVATGFVQRPWGVNYGLWIHPLTPYRRQKEADAPYSVKPKSGRMGYRDWVGVTVGGRNAKLATPAAVVSQALQARRGVFERDGVKLRLLAAGWAMNNMEAQTCLFSVQPLYLAAEDGAADAIASEARAFADAADIGRDSLREALNAALFGGNAKSTDTAVFEEATDAYFAATENAFHDALAAVLATGGAEDEKRAQQWRRTLERAALRIFDSLAPPPDDFRIDDQGRERVTSAYGAMRRDFSGHGKRSARLFETLNIPMPEKPKKQAKPKKSGAEP